MSESGLHQTVLEEVMVEASRVVELRIAQFRAFLVVFLLVFNIQTMFWMGSRAPKAFVQLAVAAACFSLGFSAVVIWGHKAKRAFNVNVLSIVSIGVDAALMALPVTLWFSVNELGQPLFEGGPLLNQPSVFAMYLLVVASGLRFRDAARFGIAVNTCVVLALMMMEAVRNSTAEGVAPAAVLAVRQHALLLIGSVLLAWFISTHTRSTTVKAAETALQATIDGLTGVYNRHHLRQELETLCAEGSGSKLHLIMTDVDHFKSINDEMGHLVGDRVLVEVSRRLQGALRAGDLVARYGGEEFCVLLNNIDDATASEVAERLRTEVCKSPMEGRSVSTSVGLSRWDGSESISSLLDRADKALYQAKEGGRNRVATIWPDEVRES